MQGARADDDDSSIELTSRTRARRRNGSRTPTRWTTSTRGSSRRRGPRSWTRPATATACPRSSTTSRRPRPLPARARHVERPPRRDRARTAMAERSRGSASARSPARSGRRSTGKKRGVVVKPGFADPEFDGVGALVLGQAAVSFFGDDQPVERPSSRTTTSSAGSVSWRPRSRRARRSTTCSTIGAMRPSTSWARPRPRRARASTPRATRKTSRSPTLPPWRPRMSWWHRSPAPRVGNGS